MFEFLFKYSRDAFEQGEFVFASGWPLWLLVLLAVLGVAPIGYTLWRNHQGLGIGRLVVLGTVQTLVWAAVLTLLWRPALLSQVLRPQENSVALLVDTSQSMSYGDGERSRLQQAVAALRADALPALAETFQVETFAFADAATEVESLERVPAPGPKTHVGDALLTVLRGANAGALGAVVLVSDGADNSGDLDAAKIAEIASFGIPVHTLGVGREVIEEDLELADVVLAPQGLPNSTVSAQVSIRHANAQAAQLKVYNGDAIVASQTVDLPGRPGVTTRWVDIEVDSAGLHDLRFALDPLPGERNLVNNSQMRPMEVPPQRLDVLYIEGEPRWEYKFMRRALGPESPVRLAGLLRTTPNKYYRQGLRSPDELEDGFPSEEQDLFDYDALVIGSFEAAALTLEQQTAIREFVSRRGGSLLMLGGRRSLADGGWGATPVAEVLPARVTETDEPTFRRAPAKAVLTDDGARSLLTRLDDDNAANRTQWGELPELADFQLLGDLKPGAVTLLEAQIDGDTQPLLVHQRFGLGQAYILATGGTWRWQMQLPYEDQRHETFWRQVLQTLGASAPQPVTLSTERVFYADEDLIGLRAEIRDREFRPAGDANVEVTMRRSTDAPTTLQMTPVTGEPGVFEATVEAPATGVYRFEATAEQGEEVLGSSQVAVRRADGIAEHFNIQQNRPLLERLAAATGGRYFPLDATDQIPEAVRFSEAGLVERQVLDLWNMPINFLLLLLLKGGEWLLRLRWGRL